MVVLLGCSYSHGFTKKVKWSRLNERNELTLDTWWPVMNYQGAFKKLKSESSTLGGSVSGSISGSVGGGSCGVGSSSHIHNPSAASCPTPARRRHRTTFTQVNPHYLIFHHNWLWFKFDWGGATRPKAPSIDRPTNYFQNSIEVILMQVVTNAPCFAVSESPGNNPIQLI